MEDMNTKNALFFPPNLDSKVDWAYSAKFKQFRGSMDSFYNLRIKLAQIEPFRGCWGY